MRCQQCHLFLPDNKYVCDECGLTRSESEDRIERHQRRFEAAKEAMGALILNPVLVSSMITEIDIESALALTAEKAVGFADALLKELEKK